MIKDKLAMAKIQTHLEDLESLLAKWMRSDISNEQFAAEAVIKLQEAKKGTLSLISKAIWSD